MFPESLETLNLMGNGIKTLYRHDFSEMRNLKVLFLDDNLISDLKWDTFDDLKSMENLSLGNNLIKVVSQRHFRKMTKLKALDLSFNCILNVRQIPWTFHVFWGLQKSDVVEKRVVGSNSCDKVLGWIYNFLFGFWVVDFACSTQFECFFQSLRGNLPKLPTIKYYQSKYPAPPSS